MDNTPNLQLPYLIAAQAQKHVTHNEALRTLDALVQLLVLDKDLASPPGSPADGSRYIVAASPTGAWAGQAGKVAAWQDGAWAFYTPREGWLSWIADEDLLYAYTGSAWTVFAGGGGGGGLAHVVDDTAPQLGGDLDGNGHNIGFDNNTGITDDAGNEQLLFHKMASAVNQIGITNAATGNAPQLAAEGSDTNIDLKLRGKGTGQIDVDKIGVNATADTTNRLALKSPASLFDNVGNGHQQKVNKAAAGDTASQLFQTGYSGRAEYGLTGDDNFHLKVSPNGSTWKEAVLVDRTTAYVGMGGATAPVAPLEISGSTTNSSAKFGTFELQSYAVNNAWLADNIYYDGSFKYRSNGYGAIQYFSSEGFEIRTAPSGSAGSASTLTRHFMVWNNGDVQIGGNQAVDGNIHGQLIVLNSGEVGVGTTTPSNRLSVEGVAAPQTDNAWSCGTASKRWSVLYAVTSTINTSDLREKTDIADAALGLDFELKLRPRAYKWLEGGISVAWDVETAEEDVPLTEQRTVTQTVVELRENGVAVERNVELNVSVPVVDLVSVVDEAGAPVMVDGSPRMHAVPRMSKAVREVSRVKREVPRPGVRTHYGLIAQEVKTALEEAGVSDFAGWTLEDKNDPSSTQGLRYDQFIAPLIKAVQELTARVAALEGRLAAS